MIQTQTTVKTLLNTLKALLAEVTALRQESDELGKCLADVQREYEEKFNSLNLENQRLEALKSSLKSRLARKPQYPQQPAKNNDDSEIQSPPPTFEKSLPPPLPPEKSHIRRKRALADHIEYFISDSNREPMMQILNAVLADDDRDLGHMLELLSWGEIWTARAEWETLEEQYNRLQEWEIALSERLEYWQQFLNSQQNNSYYGLLQERKTRSSQEWAEFLNELDQQQKEENERLAHEVSILEQELQKKMSEVNNVE